MAGEAKYNTKDQREEVREGDYLTRFGVNEGDAATAMERMERGGQRRRLSHQIRSCRGDVATAAVVE